jgi:hypothetical protein
MTPEEQVLSLLDFLKVRQAGDAPPERIPASAEEWSEWVECAVRQAVAPLLYYRIQQVGLEKIIHDDILPQLRREYHQNAARNLRLMHELKTIVAALNEHNIPIMPLKGAFLAFHVYDNPALRTMSDLDLLVPLPDIEKTLSVIYDLGYQRTNQPWEEAAYHVVLNKEEQLFLLEIHWDLSAIANDRMSVVEDIWARSAQYEYMGGKAAAMRLEDMLIHTCQHAAIIHLYSQGLRALCDVDTLIRNCGGQLDWQLISSCVTDWRARNAARLTLSLCRQFLDAPIPEQAYGFLEIDRVEAKIIHEAIVQITSGADESDMDPFTTQILTRTLSEKKVKGMMSLFLTSIIRPVRITTGAQTSRTFHLRRLLYLTGKYLRYARKRLRTDDATLESLKRQGALLQWLRA